MKKILILLVTILAVACSKDDNKINNNSNNNSGGGGNTSTPTVQYDNLNVATQTLTFITLSSTQTLTITAGSGSYSATVATPIVSVKVVSNTLEITSVATGTTTITVVDTKSQQKAEIPVVVKTLYTVDANGTITHSDRHNFADDTDLVLSGVKAVGEGVFKGFGEFKSITTNGVENFGKLSIKAYDKPTNDISLTTFDNAVTEVYFVADKINNLVRNHNYRYLDISVAITEDVKYSRLAVVTLALSSVGNWIPIFFFREDYLKHIVVFHFSSFHV